MKNESKNRVCVKLTFSFIKEKDVRVQDVINSQNNGKEKNLNKYLIFYYTLFYVLLFINKKDI